MRAHIFQHVPFEGLGSMEPWLLSAGYQITTTEFFRPAPMLPPPSVDLLIVLGGPMSVNDEAKFPWLRLEKHYIRERIEAGKPVLGICLGAQLIASALGAAVGPSPSREIGWFPIQGLPSGSCFRFPSTIEVFHWHSEMFALPPGATPIAASEGCPNQAFQIGRNGVGLQFHLETTPESAAQIVAHCREELVPSSFVQTETEILSSLPERCQAINQVMAGVLSFLHATATAPCPAPTPPTNRSA